MNVWPSEDSGDAAGWKIPIQPPSEARSWAMPSARPIATKPTRAAAAMPGDQARGSAAVASGAVVAGRSLVVMSLVRRAVQKGWVDAPATFQGADFAGRNGRLMVHLRHCRSRS